VHIYSCPEIILCCVFAGSKLVLGLCVGGATMEDTASNIESHDISEKIIVMAGINDVLKVQYANDVMVIPYRY